MLDVIPLMGELLQQESSLQVLWVSIPGETGNFITIQGMRKCITRASMTTLQMKSLKNSRREWIRVVRLIETIKMVRRAVETDYQSLKEKNCQVLFDFSFSVEKQPVASVSAVSFLRRIVHVKVWNDARSDHILDDQGKIEARYRQSHEPGISGGELRLLLKFQSGVPESSLDKKVVRHQCEIADHCAVFIHEQMKFLPAFAPIHRIKCGSKEENHSHPIPLSRPRYRSA